MYRSHSLRAKEIEKDKQFVSGMKFIYNIIKHQAKQYNITDLIVSDFNIESNCYLINNNGDILVPLEELDFRLGAKWVFANKTLFKEARHGQLRNYNKLFKDRDVIEAIRIIEKYTVQNDG